MTDKSFSTSQSSIQPIEDATGIKLTKTVTLEKTFSTNPKTRRHSSRISGNRLRDFLETLYRKKLKKCSYAILKYEFIQHFETNDPRIIDKYIGHPAETKRWSGADVIRLNRAAGNLAHFNYMNTKRIEAEHGLAEVLGYITVTMELEPGTHGKLIEVAKCIIHHEKFSYSWSQKELNPILESGNSPSEVLESSVSSFRSNLNLCVCPIVGSGVGLGVEDDGSNRERKEEEDYRVHTQICATDGVIDSSTNGKLEDLSLEELAILNAKPTDNTDKAKVDWGSA